MRIVFTHLVLRMVYASSWLESSHDTDIPLVITWKIQVSNRLNSTSEIEKWISRTMPPFFTNSIHIHSTFLVQNENEYDLKIHLMNCKNQVSKCRMKLQQLDMEIRTPNESNLHEDLLQVFLPVQVVAMDDPKVVYDSPILNSRIYSAILSMGLICIFLLCLVNKCRLQRNRKSRKTHDRAVQLAVFQRISNTMEKHIGKKRQDMERTEETERMMV